MKHLISKLLLAAAAIAVAAPASAQSSRITPVLVTPNANSEMLDVTLSRRDGQAMRTNTGGQNAYKVGEDVVICLRSRDSGYVSVWSVDAGANVGRIYPNDFTQHKERGAPIRANEQVCLGKGQYALRVGKPTGEATIYVHFSKSLNHQFGPEEFVDIPDVVGGDKNVNPPYSSRTLKYAILAQ